MKLSLRTFRWAVLPERLRGMFNLNDPRWGRSDEPATGADKPTQQRPESEPSESAPQNGPNRGQKRGPNQGPPTLTSCGVISIANWAVCSVEPRRLGVAARVVDLVAVGPAVVGFNPT